MDNETNQTETTPIIPTETPILEEVVSQPEPNIETQPVAESNEYQQILNQYAASQDKNPITEAPPEPPRQNTPNYDIPIVPKQNSFFKILFIISLSIFVLVVVALAFVYFKSQKKSPAIDDQPSITETTPTPVSTVTCSLNDKTYSLNESFPSTDGCNTCNCVESGDIVCTEKACAPTPTTVATKSATKTTSTFVAPKITPDKVTLTFYQNYIKSSEGVKAYKNSQYLTEKFMTELDKAYSEIDKNGGIGKDFILMAQDVPNTFKANIIKQDNTSATVSLTESNGWSQNLIISLVIVDNQWKIDSVALNK